MSEAGTFSNLSGTLLVDDFFFFVYRRIIKYSEQATTSSSKTVTSYHLFLDLIQLSIIKPWRTAMSKI
jgi:hypothetical protein